jgi:hypothetical protein
MLCTVDYSCCIVVKNIKELMLDDDIFSCICSYNHLSFASKEMSSQH